MLIELQEAINSYKVKAESYLAKLEEAEIARVKSARAESLGSLRPQQGSWSVTDRVE